MGKEVPVSDPVFFPQPVFSSTCAVTEVQALLTSLADRVPRVESGYRELCCLKHISSYFFHPFLNRPTERADANLSVSREVLHFNPKLTKTIPPQFKFYFFLTRHHPLLCMDQTSTRSITVQTKAKKSCKEEELLEEWDSHLLLYFAQMCQRVWLCGCSVVWRWHSSGSTWWWDRDLFIRLRLFRKVLLTFHHTSYVLLNSRLNYQRILMYSQ